MKNTDLQTALNHFDVFYKNIIDLIKTNKKASKKLVGHSIFKKSDNALFNFTETILLCAGSTVGCAILKKYNLLPYDLFLTAAAACVASGTLAMITNNVIYHINNHVGGPVGRSYARMQCDDYFNVLKDVIKKDFKELLDNKMSADTKTEKFIEFADTLNNVANNLHDDYEKLCERVNKYSAKRQKKWQPVLEYIEEYSSYLLNNAEKFNTYAEKLQNNQNPLLIDTLENLEDMRISFDNQHSSEFNEFKKYMKITFAYF